MSITVIDEVRIRRWKNRMRFCTNVSVCPDCWVKLERLLKEILGDDTELDGGPRECIILTLERRLSYEVELLVADAINDKIVVCHVGDHLE